MVCSSLFSDGSTFSRKNLMMCFSGTKKRVVKLKGSFLSFVASLRTKFLLLVWQKQEFHPTEIL